MAREELKVNIIIKGDHIFLGVQATDCDPKMTTLQGNLQAALERIPSFVEEANRQWDASPHNPKSSNSGAGTRSARKNSDNRTSTAAKPAAAAKPAQPNFF